MRCASAKDCGWLHFYRSNLFCLLVCFISLPGKDKDLSVFLVCRCACLFKAGVTGLGRGRGRMASREPCKHRSGQFKESVLAVPSVFEWVRKTKHMEFSPSTHPGGILSRRCKVEPSVRLQRLRNLKSIVYGGDGDVFCVTWSSELFFFTGIILLVQLKVGLNIHICH